MLSRNLFILMILIYRTGKRTNMGLLRDGTNSLMRYFINNFYDGHRQDSIDLILGNYQVSESEGALLENSPLAVDTDKRYLAVRAFCFK